MDKTEFAARLLAWQRQHGRHDLPWQQPRTPYRVWISEIMLQQTRVEAVIPYFQRFVDRFPDCEALAAAPLDDVLSLWSGLGYYARARNLHRAAAAICAQHAGRLPDDLAALQALPGIGRSTAAAILSMGFDRPAAILDGNVKRVLARYFAIPGWPGQGAVQRLLWSHAESLLPQHEAARYSQAMMDLGATRCTRNDPGCSQCPLATGCAAHQQGLTASIPARRPTAKLPVRETRMLLLQDQEDGQILLYRRPDSGIWGGLWSFPEQPGDGPLQLPAGTRATAKPRELAIVRHVFTHFRLDIRPCLQPVCRRGVMESGAALWYKPRQALQLGLPKPVRALIEELESACREPSTAKS